MKVLKINMLLFVMALFVVSCSKESSIETEENIPEVKVETETVAGSINVDGRSIQASSAYTFVINLENGEYSHGCSVTALQTPEVPYVSLVWNLTGVSAATNGTYKVETIAMLSQVNLDAIDEHYANGGTDENLPELTVPEIFQADIEVVYSNRTTDMIDVNYSGSFVDVDGNTVNVSGDFSAEIFE